MPQPVLERQPAPPRPAVVVPPIEAEGGEILKYMGDGLLGIFREPGVDLGGRRSPPCSQPTLL